MLPKYKQLAFEISDRQTSYNEMIIPIVIDCLGAGMRRVTNQTGEETGETGADRY